MYLPNGATIRRTLERYIQDKEIECEHIFEDKILTFTVPGTVYSINIPDEVLALNGYTLIGNYHLNENIWWRETFTDNEEDKKEWVIYAKDSSI